MGHILIYTAVREGSNIESHSSIQDFWMRGGGGDLWGTVTASCMSMRLYKYSSFEYETTTSFLGGGGGELRPGRENSRPPTLCM